MIAVLTVAALLAWSGCSASSHGSTSGSPNSSNPSAATQASGPVAVMGAMEAEIAIIEKEMTGRQVVRVEGLRFVTGSLRGHQAVLVRSGVGKVNAAMTTTLLIERFRPRCVIFSGVAGGLGPQVGPGDIVIAEKTVQHDFGQVVGEDFELQATRDPITGRKNPSHFPADEGLLAGAKACSASAKLESIKTSLGLRRPKVLCGVVATGDVFVASEALSRRIRQTCQADAVEMEGAAVAQVCRQLNVPALIVRSISDSADAKANVDFEAFFATAARNSAALVTDIVQGIK